MKAAGSIRRAMLRSITLVMIVIYGLGSLGVYLLVRRSVRQQFDRRLSHELAEVVDETELELNGEISAEYHELAIADSIEEPEPDDSDESGDDDMESSGFYYQLWDADGEVLHRSPTLASDAGLPMVKTEDDEVALQSIAFTDGRRLRAASISFPLDLEDVDEDVSESAEERAFRANYDASDPAYRVHLTITEGEAPMHHTLNALMLAQIFVGVLITLGTALLMSRLVARTCRPIGDLAAITAAIRPSDLGVRLPESDAPEELQPLVARFNELLDQVEKALHRERRFATDISHELRNPVAELRSVAEIAMLEPGGEIDPAEDPQVVYAEMADISRRLGSIIDVLTDLHNAQAHTFSVNHQACDVEQLVHQSMESLSELAAQRDIAIDLPPPADGAALEINTDAHLLRCVVDNLLGNAIAHSPAGSTVTCSLGAASDPDHSLRLAIRNPAASLVASDLEHLREPFWRKDRARSDQSHFGLGLSLVDAYTRLLGGEISFQIEAGNFAASLKIPDQDGP